MISGGLQVFRCHLNYSSSTIIIDLALYKVLVHSKALVNHVYAHTFTDCFIVYGCYTYHIICSIYHLYFH